MVSAPATGPQLRVVRGTGAPPNGLYFSVASNLGRQKAIHPSKLREEGHRSLVQLSPALVPSWVAGDEAFVGEQFLVPAGAGFAGYVTGGVPAEAGDHGVGVAGVGVDGDPAAFAGEPPLLHRAGGEGAFEEFAAVEGEADRAGAVVAAVPPAGVATAPDVRFGADF